MKIDPNCKSDNSEKGFDVIIFQCIDKTLGILGESTKKALYYQISRRYNIELSQIKNKAPEVVNSLHEILGEVGYSFIEMKIVNEVSSSFSLGLDVGTSFEEAVTEARKKFLSSV